MKGLNKWIAATGISNTAYLGAGIAALIMGYTFVAGAAFGIFTYVNYNVVSKIIRDRKNSGG